MARFKVELTTDCLFNEIVEADSIGHALEIAHEKFLRDPGMYMQIWEKVTETFSKEDEV